jgi:two-component system response regulator HydG
MAQECASPVASLGEERPAAAGIVLVVDDEPSMLEAVRRILRGEGHQVLLAGSWGDARPVLTRSDLDVVLLDLRLGDARGLDALDELRRTRPDVEVVVMTGHASVESAVGCMRRGAFDYLAKPFDDVHRVRATVGRALERRALVFRNRALEDALRGRAGLPELVGHSPVMRALERLVQSLRHNESNVLIQGESGTGKELVARAIHATSPRCAQAFVPVDCGALPASIIESELFGHERGAFTGAVGAPGLFRVAHRGTLFLDEVGEIPLAVQAKLLRALQEREVRPVGASESVAVDLRVIAATNRDLAAMVAEGGFRADLYYRLNVVRVEIPPLRSRRQDVVPLAQHFLEKHRGSHSPVTGVEPEALETLMRCDWPGNVRELENVIESALALAPGPRLRVADLPRVAPDAAAERSRDAGLPLSLEAYERSALERALAETQGDVSRAARRLGIGRSTLYRKLARYGIRPERGQRSLAGGRDAMR